MDAEFNVTRMSVEMAAEKIAAAKPASTAIKARKGDVCLNIVFFEHMVEI
jgi:hypothetical protein